MVASEGGGLRRICVDVSPGHVLRYTYPLSKALHHVGKVGENIAVW